jgi:hypothetical protein
MIWIPTGEISLFSRLVLCCCFVVFEDKEDEEACIVAGPCGSLAGEGYVCEEECVGAGGAEGRCIFSLLDGEDEEEEGLGPARCVDDDEAAPRAPEL